MKKVTLTLTLSPEGWGKMGGKSRTKCDSRGVGSGVPSPLRGEGQGEGPFCRKACLPAEHSFAQNPPQDTLLL